MNKSDGTLNYDDYLEGTKKILETSQREKRKYFVVIGKKKFIVYPNVFSPKYFKDTKFFANNLPDMRGKKFLEIGSGTGVISIISAYKGAKRVLAIDINPEAVKNTQDNIYRHGCKKVIEVREGDVYNPLKPGEKFDSIFWNLPFGFQKKEGEEISILEKSVFDLEYKSIERFIKEANEHLTGKGELLIGFSSTLGKLNLVRKFCKESGFNLSLIQETKSKEVYPVRFELFRATMKKLRR